MVSKINRDSIYKQLKTRNGFAIAKDKVSESTTFMNLIQIYAKTNYMYTELKDIEGFYESFGHKKSPETRTITPDANKGNNHYYNEKTLKVDWSCLMERERRFTKTAIN